MTIEELINNWNLDKNAVVLEPREDFNPGIIGVTEDKCHIIYSYQKLTESLAKKYEEEFYKNNPENINQPELYDDFLQEACEWVDYNTIRALPYVNSQYKPIIMYEV